MVQGRSNRNTRQKHLIVDYLKQNEARHVTAADIIEGLSETDETVGRATVYRFLKVLEDEGRIRRYTLSDKVPACYQYTDGHPECHSHYHLMCKNCGEVSHFESPKIQSFISEAYENEGFTIDVGKTVFYGLCKKCKVSK